MVERPVTDTSSEPGDFHGQNHDDDHDHNHKHSAQPDLEAVIMHDGMEWADAPETHVQSQGLSRSYANVASPKLTNIGSGRSGSSGMTGGRSEGPSTASSPPAGSELIQGQKDPLQNLETPTFGVHSLQHKAEVAPIFLGYNRVNTEGQCIPLVQVVAAIVQVMGNPDSLDVVQLMKNSWYICMTMNAD